MRLSRTSAFSWSDQQPLFVIGAEGEDSLMQQPDATDSATAAQHELSNITDCNAHGEMNEVVALLDGSIFSVGGTFDM